MSNHHGLPKMFRDTISFSGFRGLGDGDSEAIPIVINATTLYLSGIFRIFLTSASSNAPIQHVP
ncbi:MAG: hypothetical protein QW320_01720 [Ignisphaera sp.]